MTALAVLILLVIVAFILPNKYDPAILLKEWNERAKSRQTKR